MHWKKMYTCMNMYACAVMERIKKINEERYRYALLMQII